MPTEPSSPVTGILPPAEASPSSPATPPPNTPLPASGSPPPAPTTPALATPSPATPSQTPPATPPAATSDAIRQQLAARGIPAETFNSDAEAMDALLGAAQAYESGRQYIEMGRQAAPAWDEFQTWQKSKPGESPEPTPPTAEGQWSWDAPQFDPAWHQQLDEHGRIRPGADPAIASQIARYSNWVAQQQRDFWQDPQKLIRRAVESDLKSTQDSLQETVQKEIRQALAGHAAEQRKQAYLDAQKKELFQLDASGNERLDPHTGEALLTAKGQAFQAHAREADELGISNPDAKLTFITRSLAADQAEGRFGNGQPGAGQPAAQAPPQPPAPNQRQTFLEEALSAQPGTLPPASMDGTIPRSPNEPVAGQPKSARELAQDVLREHGDIP